ncbi:MAG: glycosyltransferase, partial [Prevotella sp.]|nr:glycosyltransferase [Prevotella sp.]
MKLSLSILVPVYNLDCRQLVGDLSRQAEAVEGLSYEIIVADDASPDPSKVAVCREVSALPHVRLIERTENVGRAAIRNFLARAARHEWLLFLDGGMSIPTERFLMGYVECDAPDVAYGGYIVGDGQPSCLRFVYEKQCEPMHRAEERRKRPFMHFHTCNFLVRRDVMLAHPFDERFRHYGYEDVFFGKQLRKAGIAIQHPDNPVGFFDYEDNAQFVEKTEEGLRTLHLFRDDLRGYSQMLSFVDGIHTDIIRWSIRSWHRLFGTLERANLCGKHPNLTIFKLYKLGYYLTLKNQSDK